MDPLTRYTPAETLAALRPSLAQMCAELHDLLTRADQRAQHILDLVDLIAAEETE